MRERDHLVGGDFADRGDALGRVVAGTLRERVVAQRVPGNVVVIDESVIKGDSAPLKVYESVQPKAAPGE